MFTLQTPQHVGDLNSGINVAQLEIAAISLNLQSSYVKGGVAVLSITLEDPASGWTTTVAYRDASALAFWGAINPTTAGSLITAIWAKLVADGKLPPGQTDDAIPQLVAAQAAAAAALAAAQAPPAPSPSPS